MIPALNVILIVHFNRCFICYTVFNNISTFYIKNAIFLWDACKYLKLHI